MTFQRGDALPTRPTRDESAYGRRDAAGNVLEWCVGEPHSHLPYRRPWRSGAASSEGAAELNCFRRNDGDPDRVGQNDGFRIVAWRRAGGG